MIETRSDIYNIYAIRNYFLPFRIILLRVSYDGTDFVYILVIRIKELHRSKTGIFQGVTAFKQSICLFLDSTILFSFFLSYMQLTFSVSRIHAYILYKRVKVVHLDTVVL